MNVNLYMKYFNDVNKAIEKMTAGLEAHSSRTQCGNRRIIC